MRGCLSSLLSNIFRVAGNIVIASPPFSRVGKPVVEQNMRKFSVGTAILVSGFLIHTSAGAQETPRNGVDLRVGPPSLPTIDTTAFAPPSLSSRLVTGVAGAVLGAGMGFFASQVATGDWDEGEGRAINRTAWAAVGSAGGFALGFSIPILGRGTGLGGTGGPGLDRYIISGDEMREASVRSAFDAVQLFHPEWLVLRGQEAIYNAEADNIRVYLDNVLMGGVGELVNIEASNIEYIRFFNATQATARWGTGHTHGAIQVVTMDD